MCDFISSSFSEWCCSSECVSEWELEAAAARSMMKTMCEMLIIYMPLHRPDEARATVRVRCEQRQSTGICIFPIGDWREQLLLSILNRIVSGGIQRKFHRINSQEAVPPFPWYLCSHAAGFLNSFIFASAREEIRRRDSETRTQTTRMRKKLRTSLTLDFFGIILDGALQKFTLKSQSHTPTLWEIQCNW